ncbi:MULTISPECIES: hypothetical protein [unclassified Microcoleus]
MSRAQCFVMVFDRISHRMIVMIDAIAENAARSIITVTGLSGSF